MDKLKTWLYRLLKRIESFTKTDMIYAARSGFWLMSNQVVGAFIGFLTSIIFARYLSKEVFGTYRYILSIAGVFAAFSLTGMNAAVTRATAQGYDGIFKKSLWVQARWSILQIVLSLGCGIYYAANGNYVYAISFAIIAFCAPLSSLTNTYAAFLGGKKDFRRTATYGIWSSIITFAIIASACVFYPNVVSTVAAFYISALVTNGYFCYRTIRAYRKTLHESRSGDISYGKNLSVMNVIGTVAQQIDNILVYKLLGPMQLAVYSFATTMPERIRSMFGVIATAAFPKLAEKSPEDAARGIMQKTFQLILLSLVVIGFYIFLAPYVYALFFPQYLASIAYSQIFAFSILAIAANIPLPALFAHQRARELYVINVGLPLLKIIISIITIIYFGIWGAIYAKISHYILHVGFSLYFATRTHAKSQ